MRLGSFLWIAFALSASGATAQKAEFISSYRWSDKEVGGMSGIELTQNGSEFWAISDRGQIANGQIERDPNGEIVSIGPTTFSPIVRLGRRSPLRGPFNDSEGIALTTNGEIFVSFEGFARVREISKDTFEAHRISGHEDFATLQNNSALEALAIDREGAIYTLPERSGHLKRPFPVYRLKDGQWEIPFSIPRRGQFLPVGADFGPEGRLFLLERYFLGFPGFLNRVRMFLIVNGEIIAEHTVLETKGPIHGNLEGLSVWRDPEGNLRLTMISDDNFNAFLSTAIVEYRLNE